MLNSGAFRCESMAPVSPHHESQRILKGQTPKQGCADPFLIYPTVAGGPTAIVSGPRDLSEGSS